MVLPPTLAYLLVAASTALRPNTSGRESPVLAPLYLEALDLKKRLLGDNHPHVATFLNNLAAALYKSQGRYTEAEPLYLEALDLRKQLLGDNHPDVMLIEGEPIYYETGKTTITNPRLIVEVLYAMVREKKPDRVIEIGSGGSTKILAAALKMNFIENTNTNKILKD